MNRRRINEAIKNKISEWMGSITDDAVRELVKHNSIVSGGSIMNLLTGTHVKDYDVYFRNKETARRVAEYYARKFMEANPEGSVVEVREDVIGEAPNMETRVSIFIKSKGVAGDTPDPDAEEAQEAPEHVEEEKRESKDKEKYRAVFLSSNAITLSNRIQLIIRFYGEPDEIHKNYDYVHCTNYWTSWNDELVLRPEALESILVKELRYIGSKYPLCSVIRTRKFLKRGWKINAGQYLKMLFQVSQLDLTNIDVMKEQLVGVDSAYFAMLISALETKKEEDPNFTLSSGYLAELIDRIF